MKKSKGTRGRRTGYSIKRGPLFYNWEGRVRVYRRRRLLTEDNFDYYIAENLEWLEKKWNRIKPRYRETCSLFFSVDVVSFDEAGSVTSEFKTGLNFTSENPERLAINFRDRFTQIVEKYRSKIYLTKAYSYLTTKTKTKRQKKLRDWDVTVARRGKNKGKISIKKKRQAKKRKVRRLRHRGK